MKKHAIILFAALFALILPSCSTGQNTTSSDMTTSLSEEVISQGSDEKSTQSESQSTSPAIPLKHENPRTEYTNDEVADIIKNHSGFKVSDKLFIDAPKEIDHVSSFYSGYRSPIRGKEAIDDFHNAFNYFFPDKKFIDEWFFVQTEDYNGGGRDRVMDKYDEIMSGKKILMLYYGYFDDYDLENNHEDEKDERVALTAQTPFGNSIATMNKGVTQRIAYDMGKAESFVGDVYSPASDFPKVGTFKPNSEEEFQLLDKKTSIKDAVAFFKNYVKNIPCVIEPDFDINVNKVNVIKIKEDLYYYYFSTSKLYDGIPFDGAINGSHGGRDNRDLGIAGMIKSNDVDYIYGIFKMETVMEEQQFEDYIPLEKAMEIINEKMTAYVDFEVTGVQLVYCTCDNLGEWSFEGAKFPVYPGWKVMLYNPNDDMGYSCYVNVLNGDFEYYKEW